MKCNSEGEKYTGLCGGGYKHVLGSFVMLRSWKDFKCLLIGI